MSKDPTRAQLSSRLSYQAKTPTFLLRMQRGIGGEDVDDDDEYEYDGSGRPPIPRRPSIPQRPDDEPGSGDEDDGEEKPQVVVLKEGKHLTEREVENEKRKAKGLPPLPEPSADQPNTKSGPSQDTSSSDPKSSKPQGLSFSSGATIKGKSSKRKAVGDGRDDADVLDTAAGKGNFKKKAKKPKQKLLSFDDDA